MEVGKIYKALQNVNNDLDAIKKDKPGFNYKFRGIDQVLNTIGPLFKRHGIVVAMSETPESVVHSLHTTVKVEKVNHVAELKTQLSSVFKDEELKEMLKILLPDKIKEGPTRETKTVQNHILLKINYHFISTEDGSEVVSLGVGEGMDKGDKAAACAISNSYKYVIFTKFNIPTEEQKDSDMKTAEENGIDPNKKVEPPKKTVTKEPTKSFRDSLVKTPAKSGGL